LNTFFFSHCLLECLGVPLLLHKPPGGFWAEIDTEDERNSWNEGATELKTPGNGTGVFNNEIGAGSKENSERRPNLP
jgi:hypothetical protein